MAILAQFSGFETGGLEEADAVSGSPSAQTAIVRTGSYALLLAGNATVARYEISSITGETFVGFGIYITDKTPTNDVDFFDGYNDNNLEVLFALRLKTSGNLELIDSDGNVAGTATDPFDENTWHYIEAFIDPSVIADTPGKVWVDGSSVIDSTDDFGGSQALFHRKRFHGSDTSSEDIYFDDFYSLTVAADSDALGPRTEVLGAYQNTVEDATDQGSALNNGQWSDVRHAPFVDGTQADYQQTGAIEGFTICDEGRRAGPAGDAPGTITGAKFLHRMARTNGSSPTTLDKSFGNSGDGVTAVDLASVLTVAFANFFQVSEAAGVVPTNSENFAMGMGQTGSGGRDVLAHEMAAFLLHTQPALSTTLADLNFPDQNYYLGPFGT